jgi:hypothetical protein
MLRSPTEYETTRVELSNRVAKIENLYFDSAIIFFTPKVADKGVNLANLQCTIVQITDRGEWGKEEETFTVDASSVSNRKYRVFDLNTDAEYSLKILPPPELRMGILELYFDPTNSIQSSVMGSLNNPVNVTTDFSPVIAAISANSANEVTATSDLKAVVSRKVATETEFIYTPTVWSNNPSNHIALAPDPTRFGGNFLNTGTKPVAIDKYLDISTKTSTAQYDGIIQPGGTYNFTVEEANMGYLLYALGPGGTLSIAVNVQK